jgi:hypothetical protein
MWNLLLPAAKSVLMHLIESPKIRLVVVELLEKLAERSDNKLDDYIVEQVRKALLPEEE